MSRTGFGIMDRLQTDGAAAKPRHGGIHPAPPQDDAEPIHWYPTTGLQIRVEEFTCPCPAVSYEYGVIGGAYRIRRTTRRKGKATLIEESPAVRRTVAAEWWRALLAGEAA